MFENLTEKLHRALKHLRGQGVLTEENIGEALREIRVALLVVHGERDGLFPVRMASEVAACCGAESELVVVPNMTHNEPFYKPRLSYWGLIVSRLVPVV
jgi:pimeloyl-ACP methyl ester carboxylesterase